MAQVGAGAISKGDVVWVQTGSQHEEPATVLDPKYEEADDGSFEAPEEGVMVQFHVSKIRGVYPLEDIRPMILKSDEEPLKQRRRSPRTPVAAAPSASQKTAKPEEESGGQLEAASKKESQKVEQQDTNNSRNSNDKEITRPNNATPTSRSKQRSVVTPSPNALSSRLQKEEDQEGKLPEDKSSNTPPPSKRARKQVKDKQKETPTFWDGSSEAAASSPYFGLLCKPCNAESPPPEQPKKQTKKKKLAGAKPEAGTTSNKKTKADVVLAPAAENVANEGFQDQIVAPDEDEEDEHRPYSVGYAPTGRATCRRCDELIAKGDVRISHRPLFRGQRGFNVCRHLRCATFEGRVNKIQDVKGWNRLKAADRQALEQRIVDARKEMEEEDKELQPDELVQTTFCGEMRPIPAGMTASLLPFQVEGFSWMRNQEVNDDLAAAGGCRGGILADEMGMGKTLQTITTICDNRPLLQHSRHGAKHAPDAADLEARTRETSLWNKARDEWQHEVKMNDIHKSMLPRGDKAAARAGTLVVCPVIALLQWKSEIEKFTEPGALTVGVYHGPNRSSEMPAEMMRKYDVVLTTYQCLEQDFRKMVSPNKVTCPNCGGKYKIDKLRVHLKYFCGEGAERTEAQARQRRSSNHRAGPSGGRGGSGRGKGKSPAAGKGKGKSFTTPDEPKKKMIRVKSNADYDSDSELSVDEDVKMTAGTRRPSRSAARQASTKVAASVKEWGGAKRRGKEDDDDDDESSFGSEDDDGDDDDESDDGSVVSEEPKGRKASVASKKRPAPTSTPAAKDEDSSDDSDDDVPIMSLVKKPKQTKKRKREEEPDDAVAQAREKQRQALANVKKNNKKEFTKKGKSPKKKGKGKSKKNDPGSDSDPLEGIDMNELAEEAMSGARFSILHSFCWWRIVLDEAHFIKSRSSQTAAAAFSLTAVHRWCCSGTPLQNRVGELYSLIRFLRIDPMAYYYCRNSGCDCKSVHYRMKDGVCQDCHHRAFSHYSHFNRHILNVIQREGYSGDGRRAMFKLKGEVLDKCMIRRTKETRAEDLHLPPRFVNIRPLRLHPIEEDFYKSLYMETKASFNDYVREGTLMNNYAHIFDLLTKMRQAVDHPYLIVYSKNNRLKNLQPQGPAVANGTVDCELCHETPTDRVLSSCCGSGFCRSCVVEYIAAADGESTPCPQCSSPFSINLNQKTADNEGVDAGSLPASMPIDSSTVPTLKTLSHVQTGSILRRVNLAEFATSSKIEVLVQDLIEMRQQRPGSKALVFSQFVNMLDLIRWRLHSDPCLAHMGLGVRILHGGMDVKSRDQAVREFREDPSIRVLLMSLKAGGVALNLTIASEVFIVDNWWNPAAEMQAIDRTHRLGQHKPIRATRYVCEGTVEERVLQLQEKKRLVFDGTVGRDAGSLKALSVNDMKALFT